MSSTIQLNHVAFTRNKLLKLLRVKSRYNAIIQKNTLTENVLWKVYDLEKSCTIQLNNVALIWNRWSRLLQIKSKSTAIIQSNTLVENTVTCLLYDIQKSITIQLNQVAFSKTNLSGGYFWFGRILAQSSRTTQCWKIMFHGHFMI